MKKELITYLSRCLLEERIQKMEQVLNHRTRYVTVVLEDIFQSQNASAVLRTCDCFGIQDVHIVENQNKYQLNRDVILGASNWLTLHRYNEKENNSLEAIQALKKKGYRIVATSPHKNDFTLNDLPLEPAKVAFAFGREVTGLSKEIMNQADAFLKIPMYGFTESLNISVTAAIVLNNIMDKLRKSNISWNLSEEEIDDLKIEWYTRNLHKGELVAKRFYEEQHLL